jgi:hypothetical protein
MSPLVRSVARCQRGIAAVELALILPLIVLLLAVPLYFGRVFWHYTAAQKAAQDAARYLSMVPSTELADSTRVRYALKVAQDIAEAETAELNPGPDRPYISVTCDDWACDGFSAPTTVGVSVHLKMVDAYFPVATSLFGGDGGIVLRAAAKVHYVGK